MKRVAPNAKELTVGQVAQRAGSVSALHFYERQGLIHSRRTTGNQRRYRRDTLRRVSFIRISQRVGIPGPHPPGPATATRQPHTHPHRLDQPFGPMARRTRRPHPTTGQPPRPPDRLHRMRLPVLDTCTLSNPDDELATSGPGPRRLMVDQLKNDTC